VSVLSIVGDCPVIILDQEHAFADAKHHHVHLGARIQRSTAGVPDNSWISIISIWTSILNVFVQSHCCSVASTKATCPSSVCENVRNARGIQRLCQVAISSRNLLRVRAAGNASDSDLQVSASTFHHLSRERYRSMLSGMSLCTRILITEHSISSTTHRKSPYTIDVTP